MYSSLETLSLSSVLTQYMGKCWWCLNTRDSRGGRDTGGKHWKREWKVKSGKQLHGCPPCLCGGIRRMLLITGIHKCFQISRWGSSIFLSTAGLLWPRATSSLVWIKNVGQTLKTRVIYPGDSQGTQISFCFRDRCSFFLPKTTQDLEINYMYRFTEATTW